MKYFDFLNQIQTQLKTVTSFEHDLLINDFLAPSDAENSLVIRESEEGPEVMVCISEGLLKKFENALMPRDFSQASLPDLSIVIEELSHFNTFCDRIKDDQKISQLELEVQGEVDKFALALEWLEQRNEAHLQDSVFEQIFGSFRVGDWVSQSQRERYLEAHHIARQFCRSVMDQGLTDKHRRAAFQDFFHLPRERKLNP
jgi:hypothetical protein